MQSQSIDNLTIGEAKQLAAIFNPPNPTKCTASTDAKLNEGLCICVMDKGFVYVGVLTIDSQAVTIANAKNIRRWGTTHGLGQLANNGPQEHTKMDDCGMVRCLSTELKHWIPCKGEAWNN